MTSRISPDGWVLQATSGTVDGITALIRRFWYSQAYTVDPETLAILRNGERFTENFRVVRKGRQLRFEGKLAREVLS